MFYFSSEIFVYFLSVARAAGSKGLGGWETTMLDQIEPFHFFFGGYKNSPRILCLMWRNFFKCLFCLRCLFPIIFTNYAAFRKGFWWMFLYIFSVSSLKIGRQLELRSGFGYWGRMSLCFVDVFSWFIILCILLLIKNSCCVADKIKINITSF